MHRQLVPANRQPSAALKSGKQPGYRFRHEPEVIADFLVRHGQTHRRMHRPIRELVHHPENECGEALLCTQRLEREVIFQPGDLIAEGLEQLRPHLPGPAEGLYDGLYGNQADHHVIQGNGTGARGTIDQGIETQYLAREMESADPFSVVMRGPIGLQRSAADQIDIRGSIPGPVEVLPPPDGPHGHRRRERQSFRVQLPDHQLSESLCRTVRGVGHGLSLLGSKKFTASQILLCTGARTNRYKPA
jgi:hypothetical protein